MSPFTISPHCPIKKINDHKIITEVIPLNAHFTWTMSVFDLSENIPAHYHKIQTQLITILEGSLEVQTGSQTITLAAGDYASIPPYVAHAFFPKEKTRFVTLDFPGFQFPEDVYSDTPSSKKNLGFIFQGENKNIIDAQTKLNPELIAPLTQPLPLSPQLYLEKFSQDGYDAYTLAQDNLKSSIAILDVHEAPEHYHQIETEHFIVLNGELEIILNGISHHLLPGQSVHIPPGIHHLVKSALPTPVRLLCINFPSFDSQDFYLTEKSNSKGA